MSGCLLTKHLLYVTQFNLMTAAEERRYHHHRYHLPDGKAQALK